MSVYRVTGVLIIMDNEIMSLEDAKQQLTKLMNRLNKTHREHLLSYAIQEWMTVKIGDDESGLSIYLCH